MSVAKRLIGKPVLVRDNMAGVLYGRLLEVDGKEWALENGRKIHYWTKAAAVEGISVMGKPGDGSRITPAVPYSCGFEAAQILEVSEERYADLCAVPVWEP